MKKWSTYGILLVLLFGGYDTAYSQRILHFGFLNDSLHVQVDKTDEIDFKDGPIRDEDIQHFYQQINQTDYTGIISQLLLLQARLKLDDWLFYQLIRRTAQEMSPKEENYHRYTLYKWFLLSKCGYDATVAFNETHLTFYVRSDENIYGIPYFNRDAHLYICLNYHDYGSIDFEQEKLTETSVRIPEGQLPFSYKITQMPDFKPDEYAIKDLQFDYNDQVYHFQVKLNPQVKTLFNNYPVADFETYFNIPLSKETYQSLIPELKRIVKKGSQKEGVDFLMQFTRYSFLYQTDQINFGKEKRLSPEQTLLYEHSDCDDRAALFFYLVKEIYNLPMIVLLYPSHVTMGVQFDKPVGDPIMYKGKSYSICDPTPQKQQTNIGELTKKMKHMSYEVVYEYNPYK
jgi:hypothetical protein